MEAPFARLLPSCCKNPDYSRVLYPNPPSHDFVTFVIMAEMNRRFHKAPRPLKIRFMLLENRLGKVDFSHYSVADGHAYQCGVDQSYSDMMIPNVLMPAIEMIGAVRETPDLHMETCTEADLSQYVEYDYHLAHLIDAARQGHEVPRLSTVAWAEQEVDAFLAGRKPVVITLREATLQPERNSQIAEWLRFAASIDHPVIFVRDTAQADARFGHFETYPRASRNAYVRAALYRRALCNLMVCTGPVNWCDFTDAPLLLFKHLVPALPSWAAGQPEGWRDQCHLEVGDQLPWALPTQRFTWKDDTFDNIKSEFDNFMGAHGCHA